MVTSVPDITTPHWQPALGVPGGVVQDESDVAQAIAIILKTRKGEDPLRPEFGSGIWDYIDKPINMVRPHIVREALDAITRWEPRATVTDILATHDGLGHLTVMVRFETQFSQPQAAEVRFA